MFDIEESMVGRRWSVAFGTRVVRAIGYRLSAIGGLLIIPVFTACGPKQPPADFAPDPTLVDRIAEIRMHTQVQFACPGRTIAARYEAVLNDGSIVPFSREYDEDNPPPLHVVFLRRTSPDAYPEQNGNWDTVDDPLATVMAGFRLRAELRANATLVAEATIAPEYRCLPNRYSYFGTRGRRGEPGGPGPDIVVRIALLRSPFYERLVVVTTEVGGAPPRFILQDADIIPPADWLVLESFGGRGGKGVDGAEGAPGAAGQAACPGGPGGAGGAGGPGGAGAAGGQGGPITLLVTEEDRYLVGLVQPLSGGGSGGAGGTGGEGGAGGSGGRGTVVNGQRCANGPDGADGQSGQDGPEGPPGRAGSAPRIVTVEAADIFPRFIPQPLRDLIDYTRQN